MTLTTEAVLSIEVVCDECPRKRGTPPDVFLEMAPKPGTKTPFFLCVACWLDHDGFDGPPARSGGRVLEADPPTAGTVPAPSPSKRRGRTLVKELADAPANTRRRKTTVQTS